VSDPAAWAGVALALLSFAFTEWRLRQERRRRRALGPAEEARAAIVDMRRCFTELSASGGTDKKYFLTEENQHVGERVRDCIGRVADQRLKDAVSEAAKVWNEIFASAPPPKGTRVYVPGQPDPPSYAAQDADAMKRSVNADQKGERAPVENGSTLSLKLLGDLRLVHRLAA
jgi:hypothetical protein